MVKSKPQAFSWTQPCCNDCWEGIKLKTGRQIDDINEALSCCYCKAEMVGGYKVRVNPGTVPYPTIRKDEDGNS